MLSSSLDITCSNIALCSINIPFHMKDSSVELQNRTDARCHFIQWRIQSKYRQSFSYCFSIIYLLYMSGRNFKLGLSLYQISFVSCAYWDPILFVIGDGSEIIRRLYLSSQLTVWSYIPSRYRRRRASSYFPIPIFKLIEHFLQQTNKVIYAKFRHPKLVSTICCYIRKLAVLFYEDNLIFFSLTVDSSNMELVLHQIYIPEQ